MEGKKNVDWQLACTINGTADYEGEHYEWTDRYTTFAKEARKESGEKTAQEKEHKAGIRIFPKHV